jgi:hypothetical protein
MIGDEAASQSGFSDVAIGNSDIGYRRVGNGTLFGWSRVGKIARAIEDALS